MELKDVFTIVKADRYTDAGRAEIDDARRTYKPGEISEKTGLQKQSNGTWAPPKGAQQAAGTTQVEPHGAAPETSSGKWQKNEDYLGRERISMKTPQGGKVSIYESDNPKQKNARFRVDTGSHYNEFNTMEEAKAFAEKQYGAESKPAEKKSTAIAEWEESAKTDAKSYNENMVILQNEKGETTAIRESSPDVEKAEAHGFKKMSLVRPDGSVKKDEGKSAVKNDYSDFKTKHDVKLHDKTQQEADKYMKENGFELQPESRPNHKVYKNKFGEKITALYNEKGQYQGGSQTPAKIPGFDNHRAYAEAKGNKYLGQTKTSTGLVQVYETPEGKIEQANFDSKGRYTGGSVDTKEQYKKWYDFDLKDAAPRVLTGDCKVRVKK